MEVLTVLASHQGRVVSRDELLEKVWPGVIVTEHTVSRCIYLLRNNLNAIGTDSGQFDCKPIETLPKRGYRLRAAVETLEAACHRPVSDAAAPVIPFVVGQWVRGHHFYGRASQRATIFTAVRPSLLKSSMGPGTASGCSALAGSARPRS
jgi:hypothetical protein